MLFLALLTSIELQRDTVPTLCDIAQELHEQPVDIDALSYAIARQETGNCTATTGSSLVNNCHGIKKNGAYVAFDSPADSHRYFKSMWLNSRIYARRFPTCTEAEIYVSHDIRHWMNNVVTFYLHYPSLP